MGEYYTESVTGFDIGIVGFEGEGGGGGQSGELLRVVVATPRCCYDHRHVLLRCGYDHPQL